MNRLLSKVPAGVDALLAVVEAHGTPTYAYVEPVIRDRCTRLRSALDALPARLLYAMKANANPAVLRIIHAEGLGIDAVSPAELDLALRLGFSPDRVLFSANNMTEGEMHAAHRRGVMLNIGELPRLDAYGRAYPGTAVCVRLNPQVGAGHHEHVITAGEDSKFGIPVHQIDDVKALAREHDLQLVGLHQHIGSGILEAGDLWRAIEVMLEAANAFPDIRFVNVGGGLGIPYRPDDRPLDLDGFRETVVAPLQAFLHEHPSDELEVWLEPGRYFVAEAGVLLVRVNTIKRANGRVFAGTDSGMGHLVRPTIYGAYHGIVNLSNPDGPTRLYDVTGNYCESADLFARARPVQEIREGDVLAILDAGAYGMSMASEYNLRPLPAEALVREDGTSVLVRRRETSEELVDRLLAGVPDAAVTDASSR